jgi:3alpha(or 20beta)-hydroxysteroid dehydrogenase
MGRFEDKVVIVTGAGGGIGRAAAVRFADEGARVLAVDVNDSLLEQTAAVVESAGQTLKVVNADVSNAADVERYVDVAVNDLGGVDVLFNNAGIEGAVAPLERYPEDIFDQVMAVNVRGIWLGMRQVAAPMRERGGGVIINTASVAGLSAVPTTIAYGASKHAVIGMTKTAALELASSAIRVNAVCPAPIETRMMRSLEEGMAPGDPDSVKQRIIKSVPLGRYGEPEEVAALVAFLASTDASYITGGIYTVDGGQMAS